MKPREPEPQFHQIAKGQPQVQSNKFYQSNQQIRTTKFEEDYGKPKEGQQSQLQQPQSQSGTVGEQQTSFADKKREAHTVPAPHQNVPQAANQQQTGQQEGGRESKNDEQNNTIYYEQKMENTVRRIGLYSLLLIKCKIGEILFQKVKHNNTFEFSSNSNKSSRQWRK
jgi:hypothetical protein